MKKLFLFSAFLLSTFLLEAQIQTNTFIFSKMDIEPQHILWDGEQTMLMGFTPLMSSAIDIPGPTLIYTEGDSVKIELRNMSQGASHTIHLHGLDVDQWNDGVPHLSFEVGHNETKSYFFKAPHPGTYLYHCHVTSSLHVQSGMYGMLIIKPEEENITWDGGYSFNQEYAWMMSEIDTVWHHDSIINHPHDTTTNEMLLPDYNPQYFLVNGRSEQQLDDTEVAAIDAHANEVILLRLANIGYYGNKFHFPMHLNARIISSDGRPLPSIEYSDTLTILPGERYQVLLQATYEFSDDVLIDYFDLNTQTTNNTQAVPIEISGFLSANNNTSSNVRVYPNPADSHLTLVNYDGEISVYDSFGMLVIEKTVTSNGGMIDINHLPSGVYYLHTSEKTFKVIKQ
jgi:FtsP/CotA-like multicopper oxidase with cupredoxin domain